MGAKPKGKRHGHRGAALFAGLLALTALYALFVCGNPNPFRTVGEVVDFSERRLRPLQRGRRGHGRAQRRRRVRQRRPALGSASSSSNAGYRERLGHAMPDLWGTRRTSSIPPSGTGARIPRPSDTPTAPPSRPPPDDILVRPSGCSTVTGTWRSSPERDGDAVEIVQQNPGPLRQLPRDPAPGFS